jgi:hypothetical protein
MEGTFRYPANHPTLTARAYLCCMVDGIEILFVIFHSTLADLMAKTPLF